MYAVTGPHESFDECHTHYALNDYNVYFTSTAIQIIKKGSNDIYDMLCFNGEIELLEPDKNCRFLVFIFDRSIYYYVIAERITVKTAFVFTRPYCSAFQLSEKTVLLADEQSIIIYGYIENSIVSKQDTDEQISYCAFFKSENRVYVLLNGRTIYVQIGLEIRLYSRLSHAALAFALWNSDIVTLEISGEHANVKFKQAVVGFPAEQCEDHRCSFSINGTRLFLTVGAICYLVRYEGGELALSEENADENCAKPRNESAIRLVDHNIYVYSDFELKIDKLVPALLYYDPERGEVILQSITATKELSFACGPFELYSFISTNRYQIFAVSHYEAATNESCISLYGIQQFETCETINDVVVFGEVVSLVLQYFDDYFACTALTSEQDVYVYNVTDKSVACINVTGSGYQYVYQTRQEGILIGVNETNPYLIDAIDELDLHTAQIDCETVDLLAEDYFVMYSRSEHGKLVLPFDFSLENVQSSGASTRIYTMNDTYKQHDEFFEINPMQIIQYINFYIGRCQKNNKYVAGKITVQNDNYFNENSSFSVSCEQSMMTETTQSDVASKMKEKLYVPDIIALKEKYLSMSLSDILKQSITRTAQFCDFARLQLDDEHDFFYYSQIFLCLFNTCRKFNNFGFTGLQQQSLCSLLQLLIPIIKALDGFESGCGLVQTVVQYLGIDSYRASDLRLYCTMLLTARNHGDICNYERTYSILVIFAIIYYVEIINERFDNFYLFRQFEAYIQNYCSNAAYNISLLAVYDFMEHGNYCLDYAAIMLLLIYYSTKCQNCIEQVELTHMRFMEMECALDLSPDASETRQINYYIICIIAFCAQMCQCAAECANAKIATQRSFFYKQLQEAQKCLASHHSALEADFGQRTRKTRRFLQLEYLITVLAADLFEIDEIFREKFDDLNKELSLAEQFAVEILRFSIALPDEANRFFVYEQLAKFLVRLAVTKTQEIFRRVVNAEDNAMYASLEKFFNFVRNSYPALIQYYGVGIIEMLIPVQQQQFQQQILSERSTEMLQQILRIVGVITRTCDHACTTKQNDATTLFLSTEMRQLKVFDYSEYELRILNNNQVYDIIRPVLLEQPYVLAFAQQEMAVTLLNAHASEGVCIPLLEIEQHNSIFRRYERQANFAIPDLQMFFCYHVNAEKQLIILLRANELDNSEFNQHAIRISTALEQSQVAGYFKVRRNAFSESRFTKKFQISVAESSDQLKLVIH